MRNPPCGGRIPAAILEQLAGEVLQAVALEETVLSDILVLERNLIQRAKNDSGSLDEFVALNESVNSVIRDIAKLQLATQTKLKTLQEMLPAADGDGAEEE